MDRNRPMQVLYVCMQCIYAVGIQCVYALVVCTVRVVSSTYYVCSVRTDHVSILYNARMCSTSVQYEYGEYEARKHGV